MLGKKKKRKRKTPQMKHRRSVFPGCNERLNCVNPEIAGSAHQTSNSSRYTHPKLKLHIEPENVLNMQAFLQMGKKKKKKNNLQQHVKV